MWRSVVGGAASTWSDALPVTPYADFALIVASPVVTPVARPAAFTVAASTAVLDHANVVPGIGLFDASNAVAVNCCVAPTVVVAVAGATTMLATGCGGVSSASLQAPKVLVPSGAVAAQTFEPL